MTTDTQTQKYRATPPAPLPQHWFNSPARHKFRFHQQRAQHQDTSHLNALQRRLYRNGRQWSESAEACVQFCAAVCYQPLFHVEDEQIRRGDNETNGRAAATFTSDLRSFTHRWVINKEGTLQEFSFSANSFFLLQTFLLLIFPFYPAWVTDPMTLNLLSLSALLSTGTKTTSRREGKTKGQFTSN